MPISGWFVAVFLRCFYRRFRGFRRFRQVFFLFLLTLWEVWLFIVGNIESAALEDDTGSAGYEPSQFALTFRATGQRSVSDLLEFFKRITALNAFVFVSRHYF